MEELRERRNKREGRHRDTWDPFQLNPIGAEKETKKRCMRFVQYMVAVMVGILVLVAGVLSKGALLIMCTVSGPTAMAEQREKQYYTLLLTVSLVVPNFLVFLKSLWKCAFKSSFHTPNMKMMGSICLIESLVALGTGILVLIVMPQFDILTNLFISGGVSLVSSLLQIGFRLQFRTQENWKIIFPICSVLLVLTGYSLLGADFWVREETHAYIDYSLNQSYWYVLVAILASTLVSLNWWENPFQASNKLQQELADLDKYRDFVFVFSSLLRIFIVGAVWVLYYSFIAPEKIVWDDFTNLTPEMLNQGLSVFFLQTICSMLCHWFGLVACKIHAVRMSFAVPVALTGPATLLLGLFLFVIRAHLLESPEAERADIVNPFFGFCAHLKGLESEPRNATVVLIEVCRSVCRTSLNNRYAVWPVSMLALEGVCMWVGLLCATRFVWKTKVQRIERTSQLFVRRLYEAAFIDQSLLLNVRMKVVRAQNEENKDKLEDCMIYFCATMWHETYDEMLKILTSMFRFDRYRGDPKEEHSDSFDFECHILVDDAYMKEKGTDRRVVNEYVNDLIHVVIEVYRVFTNKEPDEVSIIETPYGGRLVFVMPEGNMLYVHLKDKALIRNKKRWSQIMYMYYLLGWKGYQSKNPPKIPVIPQHLDSRRGSLISLDGESYLLQNDTKRRHIADDHTYILALDGDTDFRPEAVILLVDRLRMYDNVGAACGRIHPTGMGPMVWYQKFEYAVGHWLQKTAEHVFGSVLCSPGCFSLFRGSAIMDDNILKRYTTKATRGSEYVQYDQGEDRWLCTLLLQQGWRVEYNAASDAYTNSPQEFAEFYNQRRRWGPSTLANTLDLLGSGKETVKKNTSISGLYIFYQIFTVGSSILGPASVTLMVAGAFQFVFKLAGTISIIISSIPPVIYIIICFTTKSNFQITIAAIMSVLYAFLMTASFFSIIGDMVTQGTFITPTGIFLISMAIMYLVTAILHPQEFSNIIYGLMYFICIPSGYLLLTIYSLVNMNNVSWGTRESSNREEGAARRVGVLCDRTCKLCCWDMTCQVTQETESLLLQQVQQAVGPRGQPTPPGAGGAAGGAAAGGGGGAEAAAAAAAVPVEQGAENGQQHDQPDARPEKKEEAQKTQRNLRMRKGARKDSSSDSGSEKSHSTDSDATAHAIYENEDDDDDDDDNMIADDMDSIAALPESEWVSPVKAEFMKKLTYFNLKRNLQAQIRYTLRAKNQDDVCEDLVMNLTDVVNSELNEVVGPEDVLEESQLEELQYALNEAARRILKTNRMERLDRRVKRAIERTLMAPQVEPLAEDETDFWHKLLERYLKPIDDPKEHMENVKRELKALRNRAVFLYFMLNLLWVVATFFLQAIGTETLSIKIPKFDPISGNVTGDMNIEPVSLMFLLSFAVLLIVQFLAMLYHRVYTLIHVVSYRSTEKDYVKTEDGDEEDLIVMNEMANGHLVANSDDYAL